jgi:hypothetical protein
LISTEQLLSTDFTKHVSPDRHPTDRKRFNDGPTEYVVAMRDVLMHMKILELESDKKALRECVDSFVNENRVLRKIICDLRKKVT